MSSGTTHNARQQAARLRATARAVQAELGRTLPTLAGQVAATMRIKAPKDLSVMENSVHVQRRSALAYFVEPQTDYAKWVDRGRKPGKGLPKFAEGLPAVEWLRRQQFRAAQADHPKKIKPRRGSQLANHIEMALEGRYMAWSRAVKARGIKAKPFVKPTADAHRQDVHGELVAAVRRGIAQAQAQSKGAKP